MTTPPGSEGGKARAAKLAPEQRKAIAVKAAEHRWAKESGLDAWDFKGHTVRTSGTFEAPLFCAADVCAALGIVQASVAVQRLDPEDVHEVARNKPIVSSGNEAGSGGRKALYVTESGLYELVMGSNKPQAREFKRWVTGEVLPEIRKRGFYSIYEQQIEKQKTLLLAEHFPGLPGPTKGLASKLIEALLRKFGWVPTSGKKVAAKRANPPWGPLLGNRLWDWSCRIPDQQKHRRSKNPAIPGADGKLRVSWSKSDTAMMSPEAEESFRRVCDFGELLVGTAGSWEDWNNKMELTFGRSHVQLPIMVPMMLGPKT